MYISNISYIFRTSFLFALFIALFACNGPAKTEGVTDYDRLCKIYADIVQQPIDLSMKEIKITERVQKEFPVFFENNFVHISAADPDKRYQFVKRLAKEETKKNWDCEVMRSYYANEFK